LARTAEARTCPPRCIDHLSQADDKAAISGQRQINSEHSRPQQVTFCRKQAAVSLSGGCRLYIAASVSRCFSKFKSTSTLASGSQGETLSIAISLISSQGWDLFRRTGYEIFSYVQVQFTGIHVGIGAVRKAPGPPSLLASESNSGLLPPCSAT